MRFLLFCSVPYGVFTSPAAAVQTPAAVRAERRPAEPRPGSGAQRHRQADARGGGRGGEAT